MFPADEPDKLEEFKHAIKLVQLIVECQHEVNGSHCACMPHCWLMVGDMTLGLVHAFE